MDVPRFVRAAIIRYNARSCTWSGVLSRISRYILKEIAVPALLALAVFGFLGVANEVNERVRDEQFDMAYANVSDFARMTFWFMPTLIYYVVPVMYMMGIMLAFGRLTQHNEITAMKAAGVPLKRIVTPVLVMGAFLSLGSFVLQDRIQPFALGKINELIYTELPRRVTMDVLSPGVMHQLGDWRVYIGAKDRETDTLYNVDILQPQEGGNVRLYHADEARFLKENGRASLYIPTGYQMMPGEDVGGLITDFTLSVPVPQERPIPSTRRMRTLYQLLERDTEIARDIVEDGAIQDIREIYKDPSDLPQGVSINALRELYKIRAEIRDRIALPLACLAVSIVAAPLAVRGGRGGRSFSFAIGFGVCLVYYLLWMATQPHRICSLGEAVFRGLVPNLVLAATGVWALWRVDRV